MSVTTIGAIAAARRPRWQYPPAPPTPRILHLPRRTRRRSVPKVKKPPPEATETTGKLEALFGQERTFAKEEVPIVVISDTRRERVTERESGGKIVNGGALSLEEEKWRFQAEMLRAECNLMRMEKEIAVKKMERVRVKSQRALRFVLHSLRSISEGNKSKEDLEEEIQQLAEKLRMNIEIKNRKKCHSLDKRAANDIKRDLKMFRGTSDEVCVKKIQEMAELSLSMNTMCEFDETIISSDDSNVEILRRKMEGLSNGMLLERMKEECGSMLSTANSSVASSASNSKRIELADLPSSSSIQQPLKIQETVSCDETVCSGRCKAIVRRILEQVRAETEQWSQMQEMLGQVREEMEDLQASRDFWEDRALDYDHQMQSLHSNVQEWRQKAISSESKANQLEAQTYFLKKEIERSRNDARVRPSPPRVAVDGQHEMEKRVLICRLKENAHAKSQSQSQSQHKSQSSSSKKENEGVLTLSDSRRRKTHTHRTIGVGLVVGSDRSPLKDIGNSCVSLKRQQNKSLLFPLVLPRTSKNV